MQVKFCDGRCSSHEKESPVFGNRRFDPSLIISSKPCKYGYAQVIVCKPLSNKLRPFPTTFWLTCPYLIKLAGKIESNGGISELEAYMRDNNLYHKWQEYNYIHQVLRLNLLDKKLCAFMRKYHTKIFRTLIRSGIGGMIYGRDDINVKCLHLQTASFLGLGFHPAEKWLKNKGLSEDLTNDRIPKNN